MARVILRVYRRCRRALYLTNSTYARIAMTLAATKYSTVSSKVKVAVTILPIIAQWKYIYNLYFYPDLLGPRQIDSRQDQSRRIFIHPW